MKKIFMGHEDSINSTNPIHQSSECIAMDKDRPHHASTEILVGSL